MQLKILCVENSPANVQLIEDYLRQEGFDPITGRVETADAFAAALREGDWDAVVIQRNLPGFSVDDAQKVLRASGLDLPVIPIASAPDREVTLPALRTSSHAQRNLRQARAAHQQLEQAFHALLAGIPLPMWIYDRQTLAFLEVNEDAVIQYGYTRHEFLALHITDILAPEDVPIFQAELGRDRPALQPTAPWRHIRKNGQILIAEVSSHTLEFDGREAVLVLAQDITERKRADSQIQRQLEQLGALRAIDLAITSSLDLRLTLDVFLEQVVAQLGIDAADVFLLEPNTQTLGYAAGRGFRTSDFNKARVNVGEGRAGRAASNRRIIDSSNPDDALPPSRRTDLLAREDFVSYYGVPLIAKGQVLGVLEIHHRAPLAPDAAWLSFLEALASQAAIAIDNATLFDGLQRSNMDLIMAYDATIAGWSQALDLRDHETEGHSQRVTRLMEQLATSMGLDDDPATPDSAHALPGKLVHARRGALLHDIGKMGIPDHILLKPGPLTDDEWVIMRQHPALAYAMLEPISYLHPALEIPYCHHEKWDGTGYPRGLKGEQIPLVARIFAVVDVWDALRSDRPYRLAWPAEQVREYIRAEAGKHFDPAVAEAFLALDFVDER